MASTRWTLALIALAIAMIAGHRGPDEARGASGAGGEERAFTLLGRAQEAARTCDATGAATTLREALRLDPANPEIARELRGLVARAGLEPTPDERQIEDLVRTLGPGFRRTETKRFVVLSNASTSWTRERERLLERTYHEVMKFAERIGLPCVPPERKLVVVLFAEHADYRRFARSHDGVEAGWVAGYYASVPNHAVFYDDQTSPAFARAHAELDEVEREADDARRAAMLRNHPSPGVMVERARTLEDHAKTQRERLEEQALSASMAKTTHEAAHLIAFNTNIQLRSRHYPFWITEGFAICFETDDPSRPFNPSRADPRREAHLDELIASDALVPAAEFVGRTEAVGSDPSSVRAQYTQAWAMFKDASRYRKDELVALFADIARAPAGRMDEQTHGRLFEGRFGDPASHARAMLRRR
ncbi:MAG: DUF1570 domain-containing protein [Planctomycetota bacterium]